MVLVSNSTVLARIKGEVGLSPPVEFFTDHSKAVIFVDPFVICVSCLSLLYCLIRFLQPCNHLLRKG